MADSIDTVRKLLGAFLFHLHATTVNPFRQPVYLRCGTEPEFVFLKVQLLAVNVDPNEPSDCSYCFVNVSGFRISRVLGKMGAVAIANLKLPLDSRLFLAPGGLPEVVLYEEFPMMVLRGQVVNRETYDTEFQRWRTQAERGSA